MSSRTDRPTDWNPPAPAVLPLNRPSGQSLEGRAGAISLAPDHGNDVRLSEVVSALSYALDITEAVSADRPYRAGMSVVEVRQVQRRLVAEQRLCPVTVEALESTFTGLPHEPSFSDILVSVA